MLIEDLIKIIFKREDGAHIFSQIVKSQNLLILLIIFHFGQKKAGKLISRLWTYFNSF